jgi:GTP-binding protein
MSLFRAAEFDFSVAEPRELPPSRGREVAFAGRSNAGKSSAINALAGRTRLAFVSKTPGRTQLINFFRLDGHGFLVDLPGYGYAGVPGEMRDRWQALIERYLAGRPSLCGLVLIMDVRHPLTPLDGQLLDWFAPSGKPVHVLLTKADKLSRGAAQLTLHQVQKGLCDYRGPVSVQLFSSLKRSGIEEAETVIGGWLGLSNKKKTPGQRGEKPGVKCLKLIKAPAQGGEAGDGSSPSVHKINPRRRSSPRAEFLQIMELEGETK